MYKNKISLCSEIIVIIFSYSRSKQTARRHQAIKTRAYFDPVLIILFVSNGMRPPLRKFIKTSIAHTLRVRIVSSLPDPDQCTSNIAPRS